MMVVGGGEESQPKANVRDVEEFLLLPLQRAVLHSTVPFRKEERNPAIIFLLLVLRKPRA